MGMKPLERDQLHELEFVLRAYLRPKLFAGEDAPDPDYARCCLLRFLRDFRNNHLPADYAVTSEDVCEAIGYKTKSTRVAKQSEMSRLFNGNPTDQLIGRVAEIVAVLLRGATGKKLLSPPRNPLPFKVRNWNEEPEDAIAVRILRVLFPSARARYGPISRADLAAAVTPDERGYFEFRRPYPANSYEARAELVALGWLAMRHPARYRVRVVRVSGRCPFLQVRVDRGTPQTEAEDAPESFAADGAYVDRLGRRWHLTRSGEETIHLLSTGAADVVHVLPESTSHGELAMSHAVFSKFADRHLTPACASRLSRVTIAKDVVSVRKGSRARGCSYFHPSLRFVAHQIIQPQAESSPAIGPKLTHPHQNYADGVDVGSAAESVFPNLLVQRNDTRTYGPSLFQPDPEDLEAFRDWFDEVILPQTQDAVR